MKLTSVSALGREWQTEQADLIELAVRSPISRGDALRMQVRRDLTSWEMWLVVLVALGGLVAGAAAAKPGLMVLGGALTLFLGWAFVNTIRGHLRSTLLPGVISDLSLVRNPQSLVWTGIATLKTGESTLQSHVFVGRKEPLHLLQKDGRVEVLVHFDPSAGRSQVLAWRAAA